MKLPLTVAVKRPILTTNLSKEKCISTKATRDILIPFRMKTLTLFARIHPTQTLLSTAMALTATYPSSKSRTFSNRWSLLPRKASAFWKQASSVRFLWEIRGKKAVWFRWVLTWWRFFRTQALRWKSLSSKNNTTARLLVTGKQTVWNSISCW